MAAQETLKNFIGGQWVASEATQTRDVVNPATGERLAKVPLGTAADVDRAVKAARTAFESWRRVPSVERARYLFRYKQLLDAHHEELARICTSEHGKTVSESMGSVKRGIENVEHACGIPTLMMGESIEDVARGIDCVTMRQPVGVFAAVVPFNFPAMVPMWFWPYAVACGNTFILKPSEQVPLSQQRLFELAVEAGFPAGVLNLVHGAHDVVNGLCDHPDIAGISFVGSTPVAKHVYTRAAATGKRVQALGGAKNHILVMPDADIAQAVAIATESVFGCSGQRCLAGSVVVGIGDVYDKLREGLLRAAKEIIVGNGADPNTSMGPVISEAARERVLGYISKGLDEGATFVIDGREHPATKNEKGFFLGPTIMENVETGTTLANEEVFGPLMVLRRAQTLDDAIAMVKASPFANACSIVTTSGAAARAFRYDVGVSMLGINIGVAAPMAFFPFGGTKNSFFGDLKAHGKDSIHFFTDAKVEISRWV